MKLYSNEYVENYIIENYSEKTVREISRTLGYSDKWVQKLIKRLIQSNKNKEINKID